MEHIIVTGANGFIGKYVTERLLEAGYFIFALDCRDYRWNNDSLIPVVSKISSGSEVHICSQNIGHADVMVHLAADITVPGNISTIGNNIDGLYGAIEIAIKTGVKHFIFLSSIPVIGDILYTPIDESHPVKPKTPYHWSKYLGEKMLEKYVDMFETFSIIRIPSPIGIGMRDNVFLSMMLNRMRKGDDIEVYGDGKRIQNYIDVRDIAEAILKVIQYRPQGLFLIAGRESVSNLQLAELCKDITKSNSLIHLGVHEDLSETERWIVSCQKAEKMFNYEPMYDIKFSVRWIVQNLIKEMEK